MTVDSDYTRPPETQRYAKNERAYANSAPTVTTQKALKSFHSQYIQIIIIPIAFTLASFIGIAVTSAGITLYGEILWDPLKLIDKWDNRAGAFFTSFSFASLHAGHEHLRQLAERRE
jgi:hypothetical protein